MEEKEFLNRISDLQRRAERTWRITRSGFLTPAEQALAARVLERTPEPTFFGGHEDCERKVLFFVPEGETLDPAEHLCAVGFTPCFGSPGHRDYLGAALGLGIERPWLGDLWVTEESAVLFCLPSVREQLLTLDRAGKVTVKARPLALAEVTPPPRQVRRVTFTVQSPRLDAVTGEVFRLSRTLAAKHVAAGLVSLNYLPCLRPDALLKEGDVLSLRGKGKAVLTEIGGESRKGRLFLTAEVLV